jgi:hypothetical protein
VQAYDCDTRAIDVRLEENMAAGDIFALNNSLASRLIRCLYIVALILIAIMVVLGVVRGIRIMTFTPRPMPAAAGAPPAPDAGQPTAPRTGMMQGNGRMMMQGPANRRMMMMRRFGPRPRGPLGMGFLPRNPQFAGLIVVLMTLLRGAIMLMVVRILAEIGLAVLAMPRRQET